MVQNSQFCTEIQGFLLVAVAQFLLVDIVNLAFYRKWLVNSNVV